MDCFKYLKRTQNVFIYTNSIMYRISKSKVKHPHKVLLTVMHVLLVTSYSLSNCIRDTPHCKHRLDVWYIIMGKICSVIWH